MLQGTLYKHLTGLQKRQYLIRILVVRDRAFTEATAGQIVHDVQEVMGKGMHVDVGVVEEIPKDKSGKVRCAMSKIGRAV